MASEVPIARAPSATPQPSGVWQPLAILNEDLATLAAWDAFVHEEDQDVLGRDRFATILLPTGGSVWIAKCDTAANPGRLVFAGADAGLAQSLAMFQQAMALRREELLRVADA